MKVRLLGEGAWTVWAVMDEADNCQVLDFLMAYQNKSLSQKMMTWLVDTVPQHGPRNLGKEKTRPIESVDYIFEFRAIRKREPGLRVLWFYDRGQTVICTHAFEKTSSAPAGVYDASGKCRELYQRAKLNGSLEEVRE